jgi:type I restriction enzyme S subunit
VPTPTDATWQRTPARFLFARQQRVVRPEDEIITAFRDGRVMPRSLRRTEGFTNAVQEIGYQGIRLGDLVIHSMDGFAGAIGVAEADGKASPVVHAYQPQRNADPRYYAYLLRVLARQGFVGALAKGIRERSTAFDAETFRSLVLPEPASGQQRAIADYLDTETARIDALIAKKNKLRNALRERYAAVVGEELGCHEGVRLKHLLAAPLAYGVLVPAHDPDGVPMLRITDLRSGTVDLGSVNRIPASLSAEYRRTILAPGDLVVSVVGTLGRSIEVTEDVVGANLNRALARVQLKSNVPRPLVRLWFESDDFQLQARLATSGDSAQPTLGLGDMKNFEIGIPTDARRWSEIAGRLVGRLAPIDDAVAKLDAQEQLLKEHREALIAAAVTGELEIPGVA